MSLRLRRWVLAAIVAGAGLQLSGALSGTSAGVRRPEAGVERAAHAVTARRPRVRRGRRGPRGAPGPTGPQGPQGPPAPPGFYDHLVRGELTIAPGSADERVLTCPSGSYPAGGGGLFAGDPAVGDHLTSSGPAAGGWLVGGYNGADAPRTFTLGVICVDAPPAPSGSARTRALQVRPASARRRRHPRVRRGPRGLRGRRGPTGPAGPPGPVGIPRSPLPVVTRSADLQVAAGAKGSGQVDCQGDELVIGGGAYFLPDRAPGDHVVESGPIRSEGGPVAPGNFQNGTGWTASARNGGSATRLLRIFAQCQ